jgi:hypothetical protein
MIREAAESHAAAHDAGGLPGFSQLACKLVEPARLAFRRRSFAIESKGHRPIHSVQIVTPQAHEGVCRALARHYSHGQTPQRVSGAEFY